MSNTIETISSQGKSVNEDYTYANAGIAWVLDGSSPPINTYVAEPSIGQWYVTQLSCALHTLLVTTNRRNGSRRDKRLSEIVRQAIKQTGDTFREQFDKPNPDKAEAPLATGAILVCDGDQGSYMVLGDCALLIKQGKNVRVVTDNRAKPFEARTRARIRKALDEGLDYDEAASRAVEVKIQNRESLNTEGGYWAFSMEPAAVDQSKTGTVDLATTNCVLLLTDGFSRLVTEYEKFESWPSFADHAADGNLSELLHVLRELDDMGPQDAPLTSQRDDASLIRLQV